MDGIPSQDATPQLADGPEVTEPVPLLGSTRQDEVEPGVLLERLCRAAASGLSAPVAFLLVSRGRRRTIRAGVGMPHLTRIPFVVDARERLLAAVAETGTVEIEDLSVDGRRIGPGSALDPDREWRSVIAEALPLGGGTGAMVVVDVRPRGWSAEDRALLAALALAARGSLRAAASVEHRDPEGLEGLAKRTRSPST